MERIFEAMTAWIGDLSTWVIGVTIGLLGKISYEMYINRTLSLFQWIAVVGMSIITGYLTGVVCHNNGLINESQYLVPVGTLLGEKTFMYVIGNYKPILDSLLRILKIKR
jgi:hypothetical protein